MKWNLKFPEFYKPKNAENPAYFREIGWPGKDSAFPRLLDIAETYRMNHKIPKVNRQEPRIVLTLVDMDRDFCDPNGSLAVMGAMGDVARLVGFIYRHMRYLEQILLTADSHPTTMVTTPHFLINWEGEHPEPFKQFTAADFKSGRWRVNPTVPQMLPGRYTAEFLNAFLVDYAMRLSRMGKPQLLTWPEHCRTASYGQRLVGVIDEAVMFHEYVRGTINPVVTKGECPYLECFSALGPDVFTFHDGTPIPLAQENTRLLETVRDADAWIVGGEASTHCVPATVLGVLEKLPHLAKKTYYLVDGMSPVTGLEFLATEAEKKLKVLGVHFVKTTDPIEEWPGDMPQLIAEMDHVN